MSGVEVLGGISAVIAIIDSCMKLWSSARKDYRLPKTYDAITNRLPILRDTLQTCESNITSIHATLPNDVVDSLSRTIKGCEVKVKRLYTIFETTIPQQDDEWHKRYRMVGRRVGKGLEAEALLKSICEDVHLLVNYHSAKSVSPELKIKLDRMVQQFADASAYGTNINNSAALSLLPQPNTAASSTHMHSAVPNMHTVTSSGPFVTGRTDFRGVHAYASLHPVATYVSRPSLEKQLHDQLHGHPNGRSTPTMRTVVIWGLGGLGKSQLALNYVQTYQQEYRNVFWIEAGRKEALDRDYMQIYRTLFSLTNADDSTVKVDDAVHSIKSWIAQQKERILWVLDSADEVDDEEDESYIDLQHYLPESPCLDRIITTRSSRAQHIISQNSIAIDVMSEGEAVNLFLKCAKLETVDRTVEQESLAIVQELGCLALAVTLAGSYVCEDPGMSANLKLYLPEYRTYRAEMLDQKPSRNAHQYSQSVLRTWEISMKVVQRKQPVAAMLLNMLAFMNFDDIFMDLFLARPTSSDTPLEQLRQHTPLWSSWVADEEMSINVLTIKAGLRTLRAFSLITWRAEQEAYVMHKLVHAWSHDRLDEAERRHWGLVALKLLGSMARECIERSSYVTAFRLLPHVLANLKVIKSTCGHLFKFSREEEIALENFGNFLSRLEQDDGSFDTWQFLHHASEIHNGPEHKTTLLSMYGKSKALAAQLRLKEAVVLHSKLLETSQRLFGPEFHLVFYTMCDLAVLLSQLGEHEQAEQISREVLEKSRLTKGPEHRITLNCMYVLAITWCQQGKLKEAEGIVRSQLEIARCTLNPDDPALLDPIRLLAYLLGRQHRHEESISLLTGRVEAVKRYKTEKHPDTRLAIQYLEYERANYEVCKKAGLDCAKVDHHMFGPDGHTDDSQHSALKRESFEATRESLE